jgi:hypothetical protein
VLEYVASAMVSMAIVALTSLPLSSASAASVIVTKAPACRYSQLRESIRPILPVTNPNVVFEAWVDFTNVSTRCSVPSVWVSIAAFSGRHILATSSVPLAEFGNFVLRRSQSARAQIVVGPTNPSVLGKSCQPKMANRLAILPPNDKWPPKYFALTPHLLVCTGGSDNLGGGQLEAIPT